MHTNEHQGSDEIDYLVLGAGPAGLQLGYFLSKGEHRYRIIERTSGPGAFFERFPRTRELISFNKIHSIYSDPELQLRWDWNSLLTDNYEFLFRDFSKRLYPTAEELLRYLDEFAKQYKLAIQYTTNIRRVYRASGGPFVLEDANGDRYTARCLVVATGTPEPYVPPIPGIEFAEGYESISMLADDFEGQRVLIIGKGNSGFEIADQILGAAALIHLASPTPIQMAWKTRHPGNIRGHYTRLLDAYQLKMLHSVLDCTVDRIEKRPDGKFVATVTYMHADGERDRIVYDRVIRATGFRFDDSIFDEGAHPALAINDRLPAMTSCWESINVPDMFFAGNVMQVRDFRKASSPFIDGFRYNIRTLYHLLEQRYHGRSLPGENTIADAHALAQAVMARICRSSALWAQFGFLCDVVLVDERAGTARYLYELPVDYVHDSEIGQSEHYYTVTFQWGRWNGDVFSIDRHPKHERADASVFLHPLVRRFSRDRLVDEHHLLEDLVGMYSGTGETGVIESHSGRDMHVYHWEEHELPLLSFFEAQLGPDHRTASISSRC